MYYINATLNIPNDVAYTIAGTLLVDVFAEDMMCIVYPLISYDEYLK